jgi:hypothetical protein
VLCLFPEGFVGLTFLNTILEEIPEMVDFIVVWIYGSGEIYWSALGRSAWASVPLLVMLTPSPHLGVSGDSKEWFGKRPCLGTSRDDLVHPGMSGYVRVHPPRYF